jgi:hypothetical protein
MQDQPHTIEQAAQGGQTERESERGERERAEREEAREREPREGDAARTAEREGERMQARLREQLARPGVGAAVAGGALALVAAMAGIGEAIVAGVGAWAVYRALDRRRKSRAHAG